MCIILCCCSSSSCCCTLFYTKLQHLVSACGENTAVLYISLQHSCIIITSSLKTVNYFETFFLSEGSFESLQHCLDPFCAKSAEKKYWPSHFTHQTSLLNFLVTTSKHTRHYSMFTNAINITRMLQIVTL